MTSRPSRTLVFLGSLGLLLAPSLVGGDEKKELTPDEEALDRVWVKTDGPGLLLFFRDRTAAYRDPKGLKKYIRGLGQDTFDARKRAANALIVAGPPAVPLLQVAVKDPDVEVSFRAGQCLKAIQQEPSLPQAATRLLVLRHPPGAVKALLDYLPFVTDEALEAEVYQALGTLAFHAREVDPLLLSVLKDKEPRRRAAVAFLLGQQGGLKYRPAVRQMLADPEALVRRRAAEGLVGQDVYRQIEQSATADEEFLKSHQIAPTGPGLIAFFRKRTLTEASRARLRLLVDQLGAGAYRKRTQAEHELIQAGSPALRYLKPALSDPDLEVARRAEKCVQRIERGPGTALALTASRLLARKAPPDAVKVLLVYLPSAEDLDVEEAVLAALCLLNVRQPDLDPALRTALADPDPARRAGAAFVLGRVGTPDDCKRLASLLGDREPGVRFRTAQGLLYAGEKNAVPVLLDLLRPGIPEPLIVQSELLLRQLAGPGAPVESAAAGSPEERRKAYTGWRAWWRGNESALDLARLTRQPHDLGLTVICVFDSTSSGAGHVWEFGRDFKPRWKIQNLQGPMDAHVLPGGLVLIAEYYGRRVTVRDFQGNIKWTQGLPNYPVACARLPNGNTFVATYNTLHEYTPENKEVYRRVRNDGQIYSAQRLRNGDILYITSAGWVVELDPYRNREVHKFNAGNPGAWCGVEALPNSHVLVTLMATGEVKEVDAATGKTVYWRTQVVGAHQTLRLPNGNTMIVCMNNKQLVEVDRAGKEVWRKPMDGRPWRVHRR